MKRKPARSKHDDLDRMLERNRREVPGFDQLLAKELAELDLALAIVAMRKDRKLTQRDLARRAGLTQAMVARLENPENRSATVKTLAAVAAALGCRLKIALEPRRRRDEDRAA